jgi:hypothetical protein
MTIVQSHKDSSKRWFRPSGDISMLISAQYNNRPESPGS